MTWTDETLYEGWRQRFRVVQALAHERTAYQDIQVFDTQSHGRVMMLDGVVQITEADEFVYQEMIAHVPLLQHGSACRVLIIGAGDGGVLRRVLQHRTVSEAVMVEIDEAVIRLARQYMPAIGGDAWLDPRANVIVGDGIAFVSGVSAGSFDVIIVDSTDPAGPGERLFTEQFYQQCARALKPAGILVNQSGVPFLQGPELQTTARYRRAAFRDVGMYLAAVPTYIGGFMALGIASNTTIHSVAPEELEARATAAGVFGTTRYWTPLVHQASFYLPPYISQYLAP